MGKSDGAMVVVVRGFIPRISSFGGGAKSRGETMAKMELQQLCEMMEMHNRNGEAWEMLRGFK